MGLVYRATNTKLGRDIAIKVLADPFAHDAGGRRTSPVNPRSSQPHARSPFILAGAMFGARELLNAVLSDSPAAVRKLVQAVRLVTVTDILSWICAQETDSLQSLVSPPGGCVACDRSYGRMSTM